MTDDWKEHVAVMPDLDGSSVFDAVAKQVSESLPKTRPQWKWVLIPDKKNKWVDDVQSNFALYLSPHDPFFSPSHLFPLSRWYIVVRMHHVYCDGLSLIQTLWAMGDLHPSRKHSVSQLYAAGG